LRAIRYRAEHPDARAQHYERNKEQENQNSRTYHATHREQRRQDGIRYRAARPVEVVSKNAEWRKRNPHYGAQHRTTNRDRYLVYRENRRQREATGKLSRDIVGKLLTLQRGRCACCAKPLDSDYEIDHIIALSKGGTNTDSNVQLLRAECNAAKGSLHPIIYMQRKGWLL
jgi:5-methylcytosine-specific restriction endonuclease McrA